MKLTDSEKADAGLVGHMMILSITIIGISMIALAGIPSIYKFQDMATIKSAEQSYTILNSIASNVAVGQAAAQSIYIDLKGGSVSLIPNSTSQPSYILFELTNITNTTSISVSMGKIMYRLGDRDIAYEGGGVWTRYPSGSVMLSRPKFDFNGVTMTFSIVNVSGNISAGGNGAASFKIQKKTSTNNTKIIYPTADYQNPLDQNITNIRITINSEYYDAWADFFSSTTLKNVISDPDRKKVVITLDPPPLFTNFSYGALASKSIILENGATSDSYNSLLGPYSIGFNNGSIRATKSIKIDGKVYGDAMTAGLITGHGVITGNAYALEPCCESVTYTTKKDAVQGMSLGNTIGLVQGKINTFKTSNDNNESAKSGNCLTGAGNTVLDGTGWASGKCTMYSGNYYLKKFSIGSHNNVLIFDTSSGPINIALDSGNNFYLKNGNNLTVRGNAPVKLYMNTGIEISNGVKINPTSKDKSNLFQIISSTHEDISLQNAAQFTGVIWAPESSIKIKNTMTMKGAIVAESFTLKQNFEMHFDEALKNLDTKLSSGEILTYLYISQNEMVVSME